MAEDEKSTYLHNNVTSSSDNGTDSPSLTSVRFIAPVAALIIFNLIVIAGNSLVIAAVFTYRKLRTVTNTFIVSLAVSDLLLGTIVLPFSSVNEVLGWWPFGRVWCSAWLAIDVWVCTASILNLCAISLDRYLAISRPFRYPLLVSPTRAKVAVAVVWTLAMAICLPPLFGWKDPEVVNTVVTTRFPGDKLTVDSTMDHTLKTTSIVITEGKRIDKLMLETSTTGGERQTSDGLYADVYDRRISAETTTVAVTDEHQLTADSAVTSIHLYTSIESADMTATPRRITNDIYSERSDNFVDNFESTSIVDGARHTNKVETRRKSRRSEGDVECVAAKNCPRTDWHLASVLSFDVVPTSATFVAPELIIEPLPVCQLTSEPGYIIYSACGSFWIPMIFMVFFYLKIYRTAVKATSALSSGVLTKKTGRIASTNSDVAAVNLRVHRGGGGGSGVGGGSGGGTRNSGGYWIPPSSNRLSDDCNSASQRNSRYESNADDDCDTGSNRHSGGRIPSAPDPGYFRGLSSADSARDRNISHDPPAISGSGVSGRSCRHTATNGATVCSGCCSWNNTSAGDDTSSRNNKHGNSTDEISATELTNRQPCPPTEPNVTAMRRQRIVSRLSSDGNSEDMTPVPEEGIECLMRSTLTPVFEHCSAGDRRSSSGDLELVDPSQAQARRGFVQIRTQLRRLNREKKAAKTVGVIVGCFVLCWTPFFTVYVLGVFCSDCTPPVAFIIFFWLGYCNSAINPFVYALCSKDFRFAFRRLLRCGRVPRRYGSNSTLAALISGLRTPTPRTRSGSVSVITAVRFSAVSRQ